MIRVAICEDELDSSRLLYSMLEEYADSRKCEFNIETFINGKEMLEKEIRYHIAFLDIDMPEMNGIDVGKVLWKNNKQSFIVYITHINHYHEIAQNQVHSFAYLRKPIDKEELFGQIDDIISILLQFRTEEEETIRFLSLEQGIIEKAPSDIIYFEHIGKKLIVYCTTNTFQVKSGIAKMAAKMEKYDFVIPHNAFLVNLNAVRGIKKYELVLSTGKMIPLSQRRAASFRKLLADFMK